MAGIKANTPQTPKQIAARKANLAKARKAQRLIRKKRAEDAKALEGIELAARKDDGELVTALVKSERELAESTARESRQLRGRHLKLQRKLHGLLEAMVDRYAVFDEKGNAILKSGTNIKDLQSVINSAKVLYSHQSAVAGIALEEKAAIARKQGPAIALTITNSGEAPGVRRVAAPTPSLPGD